MTESTPSQWTPSSWRSKPVAQRVEYPDQQHLDSVLEKINSLPPLVTPAEIERLRHQLAAVQRNEAFLLHAGDCAESFDTCTQERIAAKIGLILSFSLILVWGARLPVLRVGRIAGQYAKPRSSQTEKIGDKLVLNFRGDNVNGLDPNDRTPDPERLLSAYFHSAATLNYIRSLMTSGFASLHHPRDWSLSHVRSSTLRCKFESIVEGLADALDFSRAIGTESGKESPYEQGGGPGVLGQVDFFTSHEALMLDYEQAMTRKSPLAGERCDGFYNTSAHFLWVGDRTRQLDGAHIEYVRGIRNPIGIKVGPSLASEELTSLLEAVNPDKEPGRVTLITRYGAAKIRDHLPGHIRAVTQSGHPVTWVSDPMHGNTVTSASGLKTRNFGTIISELVSCISIHSECGSRLGGVSLEFTGEFNDEGFSVTECLGGSMELSEDQLELRYHSFCDPRLNLEQSLDVAFLVSNYFKEERRGNVKAHDIFKSLLGSEQK